MVDLKFNVNIDSGNASNPQVEANPSPNIPADDVDPADLYQAPLQSTTLAGNQGAGTESLLASQQAPAVRQADNLTLAEYSFAGRRRIGRVLQAAGLQGRETVSILKGHMSKARVAEIAQQLNSLQADPEQFGPRALAVTLLLTLYAHDLDGKEIVSRGLLYEGLHIFRGDRLVSLFSGAARSAATLPVGQSLNPGKLYRIRREGILDAKETLYAVDSESLLDADGPFEMGEDVGAWDAIAGAPGMLADGLGAFVQRPVESLLSIPGFAADIAMVMVRDLAGHQFTDRRLSMSEEERTQEDVGLLLGGLAMILPAPKAGKIVRGPKKSGTKRPPGWQEVSEQITKGLGVSSAEDAPLGRAAARGTSPENTLKTADASALLRTEESIFDAQSFAKSYREFKALRAQGDRNIGIFRFKDVFVKVVKRRRSLSEKSIAAIVERTRGMEQVFPITRRIELADGNVAYVMPIAEGVTADTLTASQIAAIPEAQFEAFEANVRLLSERGIFVDLTKRSNFIYDPNVGFKFIDIDHVVDGSSGKFFMKEGVEHYYPFERFKILPKHYVSARELFQAAQQL